MIGLGTSSISDSWYSFAQNVKNIEEYQHLIDNDIIPIYRGHILTEEERIIRKHILNLMCQLWTSWAAAEIRFDILPEVISKLYEMENDGLVTITNDRVELTEKGRPFVRNICMVFDVSLHRNKPRTRLFSMTV